MSASYSNLKTKLLDWALGGAPSGVVFRMALVDPTFVFNAVHEELTDLTGVIYSDIAFTNLTYTGGLIRADNMTLAASISDNIKGIIIYFSWVGGSQLICYIDQTVDASLPIELLTDGVEIQWNASGIFQL